MRDWAEVEAFALSLPWTEASTSYRQPAVKANGRLVCSTGHEAESFHVIAGHDEKAVLIDTDPASIWQTPHYEGWAGLLVRYGSADVERVRLVIRRAWWDRLKPAQRREAGDRP